MLKTASIIFNIVYYRCSHCGFDLGREDKIPKEWGTLSKMWNTFV